MVIIDAKFSSSSTNFTSGQQGKYQEQVLFDPQLQALAKSALLNFKNGWYTKYGVSFRNQEHSVATQGSKELVMILLPN